MVHFRFSAPLRLCAVTCLGLLGFRLVETVGDGVPREAATVGRSATTVRSPSSVD
jgi:hypothetical protein